MLCFATNNAHKIKEISLLFKNQILIVGLKDIGCVEEIPETGKTIEENSMQKAKFIHEKYKVDCFADDSGLEIDSLHGLPGVDSAHFCGSRNDQENILKVMHLMKNQTDRSAQFKTVITLAQDGVYTQYLGIIKGNISLTQIGDNGFGYDSIFIPKKYTTTFAQMSIKQKSVISHRYLAVNQLIKYLEGGK